jgi:hypothetical protein
MRITDWRHSAIDASEHMPKTTMRITTNHFVETAPVSRFNHFNYDHSAIGGAEPRLE